jgi:signal transduction histidine kinase
MFYFTFVFLIISLLLIQKERPIISVKYLIFSLTSYTVALFSMMFYLSKDTYYYNTVYNYFSIPSSVWKFMMFTPLNRFIILNIMNASCLLTLFFSFCFVLTFYAHYSFSKIAKIKQIVFLILMLQFIIYNPVVQRWFYLNTIYTVFSHAQYDSLQSIINYLTILINSSIILSSIFILFYSYSIASPLRIIRINLMNVLICYTLIMMSYAFIFIRFPMNLIKVSQVANTTTFLTIPLNQNTFFYNLFPYYLIFSLLLIGYTLYRTSLINRNISKQTFSLSKEIAASDTTSKVFCHYMKNELLAIQSELETIETPTKNALENVVQRCSYLYERLDDVHRKTKASELNLKKIELNQYLESCLSHLNYETQDIATSIISETSSIYVLLDPIYFEQALHNIFSNAIDSMNNLHKERRQLTIRLNVINNWVTILVKDTGAGIDPENIDNVFTPFFSTQPIAKHWGVGLTLTHKIITAHEGHIEIESEKGIGTTVKIVIPKLPQIIERNGLF